MRKILFALQLLLLVSYCSFSQSVGIGTNTPNASAALDITNTAKGFLIPRMGTAAINSIPNPARGLLAYDSAANQLMVNMGTSASPNWQTVVFKSGWSLTGNSSINPANQFIGNTDNQPLHFRVNNIQAGELDPATGNIFWGLRAGQGNTTGLNNAAIGMDALKSNTAGSNLIAIGDSALFNNTIGSDNTAAGSKSLFSNSTGTGLTAFGSQSLFSNTGGVENAAIGYQSLFSNNSGSGNTAIGNQSLFFNSTGNLNTAIGDKSLTSNTTASENTAVGSLSLFSNTTGINNTALGTPTLSKNTTGDNNTGIGHLALDKNITGTRNTAVGVQALFNNTTGAFNVGIGNSTLAGTISSQNNTAVGCFAGSGNLGFNNTLIGANSNAFGSGLFNCIALGESSSCTASSQARIGNGSTISIGGFADWSNISDGRVKKNIQANVPGLSFITKLQPVTYNLDLDAVDRIMQKPAWKDSTDISMINQVCNDAILARAEKQKVVYSGFIAQDVEKTAKELGYNFSGVDAAKNDKDLYGLRYAEFVVPLVKAVQEQQQQIETLNKQNNASEKTIDELRKRLEELEKKVK